MEISWRWRESSRHKAFPRRKWYGYNNCLWDTRRNLLCDKCSSDCIRQALVRARTVLVSSQFLLCRDNFSFTSSSYAVSSRRAKSTSLPDIAMEYRETSVDSQVHVEDTFQLQHYHGIRPELLPHRRILGLRIRPF
jgi:hypothetical protein